MSANLVTRAMNRRKGVLKFGDLPKDVRERLAKARDIPRNELRSHKYGARRADVDGISFDSVKESERYAALRFLEKAGQISNLEIHPTWDIVINGTKVCAVELDFKYLERGVAVHEDVKGFDNNVSRLKRKLLKAAHNIDVVLIR